MQVSRSDFEMVKEMDEYPDLSYLGEFSDTPEENAIDHRARSGERNALRYFNPATEYGELDYERMMAYKMGHWYMVHVAAKVTVKIPFGDGYILHTVESPGLWGVESDSDDDYVHEIFKEESRTLEQMLTKMGMEVID